MMVNDKAPEPLLTMARRHVREGEERIARQEVRVAGLIRAGHHDAAARGAKVLEQMRLSLKLARRHLEFELKKEAHG
jgi:hypothetical protein